MMTTEVMWGNDHLNNEPEIKVEHKTVGEKQTEAVLAIAQALQDAETQVHYLKQRVAELEQLLQSK